MLDGPGAAPVVQFGCSSQIDLHPTGQTPQVPVPTSLVGWDLLVVVFDRTALALSVGVPLLLFLTDASLAASDNFLLPAKKGQPLS